MILLPEILVEIIKFSEEPTLLNIYWALDNPLLQQQIKKSLEKSAVADIRMLIFFEPNVYPTTDSQIIVQFHDILSSKRGESWGKTLRLLRERFGVERTPEGLEGRY